MRHIVLFFVLLLAASAFGFSDNTPCYFVKIPSVGVFQLSHYATGVWGTIPSSTRRTEVCLTPNDVTGQWELSVNTVDGNVASYRKPLGTSAEGVFVIVYGNIDATLTVSR
jgi:hypothetical protein